MSDKDDIRLLEEEEELRKISPIDGAYGRNASDYRQMYDLFLRVVEDAKSLRADPHAFLNAQGQYNDKVINAYSKLIGLGMKAIDSLNKMRNADRMTAHILDAHTRELAQAVTIEIGLEIKDIIEKVDRGELTPGDFVIALKAFLYKRLPKIFLTSAKTTLHSAKEQYGLLN